MTDPTVRRGWLVSAVSVALGVASALALAGYAFVIGPSGNHQAAAAQFTQQPLEAVTDPLIALVVTTLAFGALAALSLLYYVYAQWRYARNRRLELEGIAEPD
ncbi:hypothetical protein [Natronolimnohabitans innermongolicus]|uniref:Uncharacterized protein n=1 Tax=Natronolimnohabitans innermongolicus JCM 12255 TaxID=1227499 RepID=L9WKN0_9EURY|nr:hypothetical protein [Natronolimnohabitans innermongolicus]ELY48918.1 hypothetical protein C493_21561 [Natronolimnohabitans innermongolicus JCM 12255]